MMHSTPLAAMWSRQALSCLYVLDLNLYVYVCHFHDTLHALSRGERKLARTPWIIKKKIHDAFFLVQIKLDCYSYVPFNLFNIWFFWGSPVPARPVTGLPARPVTGDHKYIFFISMEGPYLIVSSCSLHFQIIQHLNYFVLGACMSVLFSMKGCHMYWSVSAVFKLKI